MTDVYLAGYWEVGISRPWLLSIHLHTAVTGINFESKFSERANLLGL